MSADAAKKSAPPPASRSNWPRIFLILWLAWLLALVAMSSHEWGRPRPLHKNPADKTAR